MAPACLSASLIRKVNFSGITGGGGEGGALYVLLIPRGIHQQSLQLQLLILPPGEQSNHGREKAVVWAGFGDSHRSFWLVCVGVNERFT